MTPATMPNLPMNVQPALRLSEGLFGRLISLATAAGFAGMLGSLACLARGPHGRFIVTWSPWSLALGALGFGAGVFFWRLLWQAEAEKGATRSARQKLERYSIFLGLVAFGCFVYPIRFVDPTRRQEVLVGLAMAIGALSFMGWLIFQVIRWVNSSELKDGESE